MRSSLRRPTARPHLRPLVGLLFRGMSTTSPHIAEAAAAHPNLIAQTHSGLGQTTQWQSGSMRALVAVVALVLLGACDGGSGTQRAEHGAAQSTPRATESDATPTTPTAPSKAAPTAAPVHFSVPTAVRTAPEIGRRDAYRGDWSLGIGFVWAMALWEPTHRWHTCFWPCRLPCSSPVRWCSPMLSSGEDYDWGWALVRWAVCWRRSRRLCPSADDAVRRRVCLR